MRLIERSILLVAALAACTVPASQPIHVQTDVGAFDLHGGIVKPLQQPEGQKGVVLVFIATDCPISNGYAPLVGELARAAAAHHVGFFTVYADDSLSAADAQSHHDAYGYPCDALLDPRRALAHAVGATVTPEALVILPDGMLAYRGRIDNQYASIGHKRYAATTHELKDVIDALSTGANITTVWQPAVGCAIH
jgi:thiol-disulfide isomerase/thioredoxin